MLTQRRELNSVSSRVGGKSRFSILHIHSDKPSPELAILIWKIIIRDSLFIKILSPGRMS